jgi:hypothetical protein
MKLSWGKHKLFAIPFPRKESVGGFVVALYLKTMNMKLPMARSRESEFRTRTAQGDGRWRIRMRSGLGTWLRVTDPRSGLAALCFRLRCASARQAGATGWLKMDERARTPAPLCAASRSERAHLKGFGVNPCILHLFTTFYRILQLFTGKKNKPINQQA